MRVVRGRMGDAAADRQRTTTVFERAIADGEPAVRVWVPHQQVAFGRRDAAGAGFDAARERADARGYPAVVRDVGGHAVAYTGETTLAFARAVPTDAPRAGLAARYERAVDAVVDALVDLGVAARRGEPAGAFCPGEHSVSCGGKLAGVAQRVRSGGALVGGCLLVAERAELVGVLAPVYDALGVPFEPDSVNTVADAGGPEEPRSVARAVERALVSGEEARVERVGDDEQRTA